MYSRPRAANNRPFLLIEPSYRINGDDKSKSQVRPTRKSEEPDAKVTTAPSNTKSEGKSVETPSESKTNSRVTTMSPDPLADSKASSSSSDSKVDAKVASPPPLSPSSNPKTNPKVAKAPSDSKGLASDGSGNKNKPSEKVASGDALLPKSNKKESAPRKTMASGSTKSELKVTDSVGVYSNENSLIGSTQEKPAVNSIDLSSSAKADNVPPTPSTLHANQENEKIPSPTSRPALQDNIVLGVALDGSKRTLPIEEGMTDSSTSEEEKELAACRNGNGSGSSAPEKDEKDGQVTGGGQRQGEQEK